MDVAAVLMIGMTLLLKLRKTKIGKWSEQGYVKATLVGYITINTEKLPGMFTPIYYQNRLK